MNQSKDSQLTVSRQSQLQLTNIEELTKIGKLMAESGFFTDCRQVSQCAIKVLAGQEIGIPPFAAMTGIHIVKGKPTIGANLMAALIKRSGRYNYKVLKHTAEVCQISALELLNGKWETIGESEFTVADARKAGTQNMEKFPKNMLFARCISNLIRWSMPDLFLGNAVYTPEELGADNVMDEEITVTTVDESVVSPPIESKPNGKSVPSQAKLQDWLDASAAQMQRIGWSTDQGRKYLKDTYNVISRNHLTLEQLIAFTRHLMVLPSKPDSEVDEQPEVETVTTTETQTAPTKELPKSFGKFALWCKTFNTDMEDYEAVLETVEELMNNRVITREQVETEMIIQLAMNYVDNQGFQIADRETVLKSYKLALIKIMEEDESLNPTDASIAWAESICEDCNSLIDTDVDL